MCKRECHDALSESETYFSQGVQIIQLPIYLDEELEESMNKLEAAAFDKFDVICANSEIKDSYLDKLKSRIDDLKNIKRSENIYAKSKKSLS